MVALCEVEMNTSEKNSSSLKDINLDYCDKNLQWLFTLRQSASLQSRTKFKI